MSGAQRGTVRAFRRQSVSTLYELLLLRPVDQGSLENLLHHLEEEQIQLTDIVRDILNSEEFVQNFTAFQAKYNPSERFFADNSQYGEIGLLIKQMVNTLARHRLIVDVGVLGRNGSNSYDLLRNFGWRGLLIDANPNLVEKINQEFSGLDFRLISAAVSDFQGSAEFFLGTNDGVSSLLKDAAADWGPIKGSVQINVKRLRDILEENDIPLDFDVLSLDVEGVDIKVLNDTIQNTSYRPRWIIIEASYNFKTKALTDLPLCQEIIAEYELFESTIANLMLRLKNNT